MRAIVTGGCGFIGSNLVEKLLDQGSHVIVYDNLHTGSLSNLTALKSKYSGDLEIFISKSYASIHTFEDVDLIFHLGMPSSSPMFKEDPSLLSNVVLDAIQIFEYAMRTNSKVIYASSSSLYNGNPLPFKEDMKIYVTDFYAESKYYVERLARLYNELYGVSSIGLRLFSVYGKKERHKQNYANIVSQFLWRMLRDQPPVIFGDGTQSRDFIYVDDVTEAFILAAKSSLDCEIFNVGTGVSYTFNEVVDLINNMLGKNIKPKYVSNPISNYVYHTLADTSKSERLLGFKARIDLRQGVEMLLEEEAKCIM